MAKLIFLTLLLSFSAFSESREEMIKKFLEQREKIMKDMMDSFSDDNFFNGSSMFDDDMINKFDMHSFNNNSFASDVNINQTRLPNGDIKVKITPKSKNIKLDIKTSDDRLTVTSKTLVEQKDEGDQGKSFFKSSSSSSQSIGVPFGHEIKGPTQEGDSIVYLFKKTSGRRKLKKIEMHGDTI